FSHDLAWKQIVELLGHLGSMAAGYGGITIAIEPLNRQESNIVNRASEGLRLVREVDHPNVQLLIDFYHLGMESEDPQVIVEAAPAVRHIHLAAVQGRGFPSGSDQEVIKAFERLRQIGYSG